MGDDFFYLERIIQGPEYLLIGNKDNLRIISNFSWLPIYYLFDLEPFAYNSFSLLLYVLNAIILYRLLDRLFANRQMVWLAAAFFVTGGVGADAVFWRGASATLLNVSLYLLALYTYVLFRQKNDQRYWYLSLCIYALAVFCKEEAASLPIIIVLMELLIFRDNTSFQQLARRVSPYLALIAVYILANWLIIYQIFHSKSFMSGLVKIRPLYTLFASWSVFFISPTGNLTVTNPFIYCAAVLIPLSFFIVTDKKLLCFAYLWVFVTFIPQSFSGQSQFGTTMLGTSISRHLYLPSIGSSLALAALLTSFHYKWPRHRYWALCLLILGSYMCVNYVRVQERGKCWKQEGEDMSNFLFDMKRSLPTLPEKLYFTVTRPPEGRAFMQAAVRTFYKNPNIFWKDSIDQLKALPGDAYGFYIDYDYLYRNKQVSVKVFEPRSDR